jgi:hypothetical protein
MAEGPLDVLRLCKIVKRGCRVAISNEPFWYLSTVSVDGNALVCQLAAGLKRDLPNCECSAVSSRSKRRDCDLV